MSWMKKRTMGDRCSRLYRQNELVCSPVLDSRLGHIGHREASTARGLANFFADIQPALPDNEHVA